MQLACAIPQQPPVISDCATHLCAVSLKISPLESQICKIATQRQKSIKLQASGTVSMCLGTA